jgi:uncharacterized OB-fold protein
MHPPRPICSRCLNSDVIFEPVSGKGKIYSCTINRYAWSPDVDPPYVLAEVELVEQSDLRILTNIVGCDIDLVAVGMEVKVAFERVGETWIPVFAP